MIALDTNVIVRVVTRDDAEQFERAREVMQADRLWVCKTVLLETSWVLQHSYELNRDVVYQTLLKLVGYPNVEVEDRVTVLRALSWYEAEMDFADALHLASSGSAVRFATFDRRLARTADRIPGTPRVDLLEKER